jgi:addiction module HigA family antidote
MGRLDSVHPGEVLLEEFMKPFGLSRNALAREIRVPPNRISKIVSGERSITADTALRLSRYFDTTPEFWLGLQADHDLEEKEKDIEEELACIRQHAGVGASPSTEAQSSQECDEVSARSGGIRQKSSDNQLPVTYESSNAVSEERMQKLMQREGTADDYSYALTG